MKLEQFRLPDRFQTILRNKESRFVHAPYSGAYTFHFRSKDRSCYLKILPTGHREPLVQYRDKLVWLKGRLPVPEALEYEADSEYEYLLMSEITGRDATDELFRRNAEHTVSLLAKGLRAIHSVDIAHCPFDYSVNNRLRLIESRLSEGLVDRGAVEERFGDTLERLHERLQSDMTGLQETPVFCHGDYSVPNIVIDNNEISGFIDIADAGVSDPYRDFAAAHRSIIRNFGERFIPLFYETYGIDPDMRRLRLYDLIEHFAC
ncbi:aminoglycoside 3'-phosphotransferase [Paenibacillus hemerocallicola]|uniref:Aminoglycoside 3'-phosphotransferase n=1 Tax=Paenibacillus hemerocallicola TaxID=1172614 RepID=A0A5C4T381_9BACL|nr:APH(3') family aminoglycoside O-phosphotransferase [Paenibacillus hemerocallicola]TNJ63522.1 aminoglycoside 3'-phosphotransferase [Paenibacillus hemerocallicola]